MNDLTEIREFKYRKWTAVDPSNPDTLPVNGSDVIYRFHPIPDIDSEWRGTYEDGVFHCDHGGFCDFYDVTHWIYDE